MEFNADVPRVESAYDSMETIHPEAHDALSGATLEVGNHGSTAWYKPAENKVVINSDFVNDLSDEEVLGVLLNTGLKILYWNMHEVSNNFKNIAMDLIVNDEISNINGASVHEDAIMGENFDIDSTLIAREKFNQLCQEIASK